TPTRRSSRSTESSTSSTATMAPVTASSTTTARRTVRNRPSTAGRKSSRSARKRCDSPDTRSPTMCTMIAHQVKIQGRGKNGPEWFEVREANVSYDHPYDLPLEHALNIDFVNEAAGPGARVAVELSVEAARQLVKTIEAVLAQASERGVLEDIRVVAMSTSGSR